MTKISGYDKEVMRGSCTRHPTRLHPNHRGRPLFKDNAVGEKDSMPRHDARATPLFVQVEKVFCYDIHASPIRGIQRMGRTGRHSEGHVVQIVSEGHEEDKLEANRQVLAIPSHPCLPFLA